MTEIATENENETTEEGPVEEEPVREEVVPAELSANVGTKPEPDEDDVLDLTSIVPSRKLVRIPTKGNVKGEAFELRLLDDFGIVDQQQLLRWSRRFENLWNKEDEDLNDNEKVELQYVLNAMFEKVLDAPDEIKATTTDIIRSRVVTAFTLVPLLERQKLEAKEQEEKEKATDESQSSSGS